MPGAGTRLKLRFHVDALAEFRLLDGSVRQQFKKKLARLLSGAEVPSPGSALHGFPAGYYKIKLRAAGYRLVYRYDGDTLVVLVIAVGRRDRNLVYTVARERMRGDR